MKLYRWFHPSDTHTRILSFSFRTWRRHDEYNLVFHSPLHRSILFHPMVQRERKKASLKCHTASANSNWQFGQNIRFHLCRPSLVRGIFPLCAVLCCKTYLVSKCESCLCALQLLWSVQLCNPEVRGWVKFLVRCSWSVEFLTVSLFDGNFIHWHWN